MSDLDDDFEDEGQDDDGSASDLEELNPDGPIVKDAAFPSSQFTHERMKIMMVNQDVTLRCAKVHAKGHVCRKTFICKDFQYCCKLRV